MKYFTFYFIVVEWHNKFDVINDFYIIKLMFYNIHGVERYYYVSTYRCLIILIFTHFSFLFLFFFLSRYEFQIDKPFSSIIAIMISKFHDSLFLLFFHFTLVILELCHLFKKVYPLPKIECKR